LRLAELVRLSQYDDSKIQISTTKENMSRIRLSLKTKNIEQQINIALNYLLKKYCFND